MDALDRLGEVAADLLARTDAVLGAVGAPAGHPVCPLLRRVGALPGPAVGAVTALRPEPLADAGPALAPLAEAYAAAADAARRAVAWDGTAADAYGSATRALAAYAGGAPADAGAGSAAGRVAATATYAAELVEWMAHTRGEVARALAAALGSTEAIVLRTAGPGVPAAPPGRRVGVAAAELAAAVLAPIADAYDRAEALRAGWVEPLAERHFRPAGEAGGPVTGTTRVGQ